MQCNKEHIDKGKAPPLEPFYIEPNEDHIYKIQCSAGHEVYHAPQELKFEILFEIGCHAIIDGYYREAVSSFTSALERFYEFYIKVLSHKNELNNDIYSKSWGKIKNMSERQLGAFIMLWTMEFQAPPETLSNSQIALRNSVIHKGRIPTKEEALKYGNEILSIINEQLTLITEKYSDEVDIIIRDHVRRVRDLVPDDATRSFGTQGTLISLAKADKTTSIEAGIEHIETFRKGIKQAQELMPLIQALQGKNN